MIPLEFHKFNYFYVNLNIVNGKFRLSNQLVNSGKDLIIVNKANGEVMDLVPFDHKSDPEDEFYEFEFVKSEMHSLPDWTGKLLKRFHWTWYDKMKGFLESDKFKTMNQKLNNDARKKYQVHPKQDEIYNAFSTPFGKIKVVILGQA